MTMDQLIAKIELRMEGLSSVGWLVRKISQHERDIRELEPSLPRFLGRYYANIRNNETEESCIAYGDTPLEALQGAYDIWRA